MAGLLKRTSATSSLDETSLPMEMLHKRRRLRSCYSESKCISHSVHNPTDNDFSSESEFDEHDYCFQKKDKIKVSTKNMFAGNSNISCRNNEITVKSRKPKCESKNAVIARINRLKKKKYIKNLETKTTELEAENKVLNELLNKKMEEIHSLKRETINLRNVIKNRTEIGSLLKCIHLNTNLRISSSLLNEMSTYTQDSPSDSHTSATIGNEQSAFIEEVFVAVVLWGMALHTFCQSY